MGWSGKLHAWAWRKQANMIKYKEKKRRRRLFRRIKEKIMTIGYGLGMLIMGLIAITIGASVAYYVINKLEKENKNARKN